MKPARFTYFSSLFLE